MLAEGRIVAAASLADTGDLNGAISMLATAGATKALRNPSDRHIRQWYLLADLYERAGDVPRAREYFERVLRADAQAYDVADRLRGLGPERRPRAKRSRRPRAAAHGPRAQLAPEGSGSGAARQRSGVTLPAPRSWWPPGRVERWSWSPPAPWWSSPGARSWWWSWSEVEPSRSSAPRP